MTEVASAAPAVAMSLVVEEEIRDTPATATPSVVDVLKAAAIEEAQKLEELQERVRPSEDAVPAVPAAAAADGAEGVEEAVSDAKIVDPDVVVCGIPFSLIRSLFFVALGCSVLISLSFPRLPSSRMEAMRPSLLST